LPDPAGRPLKSGRTSMSHAAISSGVAGRPTPGNWAPACAGVTRRARSASAPLESLHIAHFPALLHLPRLDRAVVVDGPRGAPRHVVETLVEQHLAARWRGDHRFALLDPRVLAQLAVGHEVHVVQRFLARAEGLVAHLEAAQPLDPRHALDAGHDEAQRVSVL